MTNNLSTIVSKDIPEYLREESPLFKEFVELYYQFEDQKNSAGYQIINADIESDIDSTSTEYIDKFFDTYGPSFPRSVALDRRNLVKMLNKIYEAKGTENALKLMFRVIFNDEVSISYPGEQRLKASDGVWVREKYITLETQLGVMPDGAVILTMSNVAGDFSFEIIRSEVYGSQVRVFFQSYFNIQFSDNQRLIYYNGDGSIGYAGNVIPSPSYLEVLDPGENWLVGQTFFVPGTVSNTLARVASITPDGGISSVEVIDYGYTHAANQVITISPYPNKPDSNSVSVESVITSVTPLTYTHTVRVVEAVDKILEKVAGVTDSVSGYFSQDYVDKTYIGTSVMNNIFSQETPLPPEDNDLTIEQWLASRATLAFRQENVVATRGYFENDKGQLSNQTMKLQDNYYYQAFSYLLSTTKDIKDYESILRILHPAGTKNFATLNKAVDLDMSTYYVDTYAEISNIAQ